MRRVYTSLATKLGAIGNSFKNKTHIYCLSGETIHTTAGVKQTCEGIATMGVPVSDAAFQLAKTHKRLANSFAQLELPQVHFGYAIMRILRFCISAHLQAGGVPGGLPLAGLLQASGGHEAQTQERSC